MKSLDEIVNGVLKPTGTAESREFSVYWWDNNDVTYEELRFVTVEQAVSAYKRLTQGPASKFVVKRCIITDGGDAICGEWKEGKHVYP